MFEDGAVPFDGGAALQVRNSDDGRPLLLVRAGAQDVKSVHRAIKAGAVPSGVTVGLGELKKTVGAVRSIATNLGVPWGCDPLLYKTAFPGYRAATSLQALDYTPGRDADPYTAAELEDDQLLKQVVRKAVGHQFDMGAGFVFAADFYVDSVDDPMLAISSRCLRISLGARDATGPRPLIAPVRVNLNDFRGREEQARLVRALTASQPDAFLLHLSGLHEDSRPEHLVEAFRLMLALQSVGAPVLLARPGDLRHIALAAGLRGVESGLGRLLRFSAPDYSRSGGPGPVPVRFEFPSLMASLAGDAAQSALRAGRLQESSCDCPSCASLPTLDHCFAAAAEHNMHALVASTADAAGLSPAVAVAGLDRRLAQATWLWQGLKHSSAKRGRKRAEKWRAALDGLDQQGLLVPDAAAEALGLTG
jgi:hypothetical protein